MRRATALLRGTWRALCILLLMLIAGCMAMVVSLIPGRLSPERLCSWWMRQLLGVLGIRLQVSGATAEPAGLVVANHVSWLDIAVISSLLPGRFVAKRELSEWPLVGGLAEAAGSYFIRRGGHATQALSERLECQLRGGGRVLLFPEGTTTRGDAIRRFHPRLFAAAAASSAIIQPLALHYSLARDGRDLAPFVGDDNFLPHLLRLLGVPGLEVKVVLAPAFAATGSRSVLAHQAQAAVASALAESDEPAQQASTAEQGGPFAAPRQKLPTPHGAR